jgi:hypothetical protein
VIADVVRVLPLYQATNLLRGLTFGHLGWPQAGAVGYLIMLGAITLPFAWRRLGRLLAH